MDSALHQRFADRVRKLVLQRGWSQNQFADAAEVSRGHLSHVLGGKKSPTLRTMEKIAKALDVEVRDLLK